MESHKPILPMGYDVQTKEVAAGWVCVITFKGRAVSLNSQTEITAIERAAEHVTALEELFAEDLPPPSV